MRRLSKALRSVPPPAMKNLSLFDTLSTVPLEIKTEIYRLILHRSFPLRKTITSCIEQLSSEQDLAATSHKLVDVAIMQVSKAISAETINLFYSINTFHVVIPAGVPEKDQPSIWTWNFTLPSQQACEHMKDLKVSFSSAQLLGPKEHDLSERSTSAELVKKLKAPSVVRNRLTVEVFHLRQATSPWMETYFFQALTNLTNFDTVEISLTCERRDGSRYFTRDPSVIEGTVEEGVAWIWKRCQRRPYDCIFTLQPRALLGDNEVGKQDKAT